jgi:hypothetical protein
MSDSSNLTQKEDEQRVLGNGRPAQPLLHQVKLQADRLRAQSEPYLRSAMRRLSFLGSTRLRRTFYVGVLCLFGLILALNGGRSSGGEREMLTSDAVAFWFAPDPSNVFVEAVRGPGGERAAQVDLQPRRPYFLVFDHRFKKPLNLESRPYLLVNFRGTGEGRVYQFLVDFERNNSVLYEIRDIRRGWREISLTQTSPRSMHGKADWSHVSGFRLAAPDKRRRAQFALGAIEMAKPTD